MFVVLLGILCGANDLRRLVLRLQPPQAITNVAQHRHNGCKELLHDRSGVLCGRLGCHRMRLPFLGAQATYFRLCLLQGVPQRGDISRGSTLFEEQRGG